jgi:hypothetical protein
MRYYNPFESIHKGHLTGEYQIYLLRYDYSDFELVTGEIITVSAEGDIEILWNLETETEWIKIELKLD